MANQNPGTVLVKPGLHQLCELHAAPNEKSLELNRWTEGRPYTFPSSNGSGQYKEDMLDGDTATACHYIRIDNCQFIYARVSDVVYKEMCKTCGQPCTKKCSGCRIARYCSSECQEMDWKQEHKAQCKEWRAVGADRLRDCKTLGSWAK